MLIPPDQSDPNHPFPLFCSAATDSSRTPSVAPLILVTDDDPLLAEIVEPILGQAGYRVLIVDTGTACLDQVQREMPDLILLDAVMPELDGFDCCQQIRSLPNGADVPIMMITHLDDNPSVDRAFAAGATDFIPKPIHWGVLKQRIRRLLQANWDRQQNLQLIQELDYQVKVRNAELREAIDFEQLLRIITDEVRSSLDENDILSTAVRELTQGLNLGFCKVGIPNPDGRTYQISHHYEGYLNSPPPQTALTLNLETLPQLHQGQTLLYSRLGSDHERVTVLCCPLIDGYTFLGFLSLVRVPTQSFSTLEIRLAEQVANQCVIGIRQSRLYQASLKQVTQLSELNQLKDEFVHMVSHELRTPLTNMKMALKLLEGIELTERHKRYFQILRSEWQREIELVNDLLDLQALESGTRTLNLSSLSLIDWLHAFLDPFRIRFEERQLKFQLSLPHQPLSLTTDEKLLSRILGELLNNACKYTPPSETIDLAVTSCGASIQIQVTNTGVEIPTETLPHIFDKFYRVAQLDRYQQGGTGLGLALVKRAAEHLQGHLRVESPNGSTRFCLTLRSLNRLGQDPSFKALCYDPQPLSDYAPHWTPRLA